LDFYLYKNISGKREVSPRTD
jgi:hypothetical protein